MGTYLLLQQAHRELQSHKKSLESTLSKPIDQPGNVSNAATLGPPK